MGTTRRRHSSKFKAKVALEATKEVKTLNELASEFGVHQVQISKWKKQLLDGLPTVFGKDKAISDSSKKLDNLYRQIGEVTVERDWLKKKLQNFR